MEVFCLIFCKNFVIVIIFPYRPGCYSKWWWILQCTIKIIKQTIYFYWIKK